MWGALGGEVGVSGFQVQGLGFKGLRFKGLVPWVTVGGVTHSLGSYAQPHLLPPISLEVGFGAYSVGCGA